MDADDVAYEWVEDWGALDDEALVADGWSHTGAAVTRAGEVVVGASREPTLLFLGADGRTLRRVPTTGFVELHAFALVGENGDERLWISDTGAKDRLIGSEV